MYFPCGQSATKSTETAYALFGGDSSLSSIDAGLQYSRAHDNFSLYFLDSAHNHYPGGVKNTKNYIRLTFGAASASQLTLLGEPVDGNGNPNGKSDMLMMQVNGSPYFTSWHSGSQSEGWSQTCSTCTVKRLISIAQPPGMENFTDLAHFGASVSVPQPNQQVRLAVIQSVNVHKGTLPTISTSPNSFPYLGDSNDKQYENPVSSQYAFEVLVGSDHPNAGTDYSGIYLEQCPPTFQCVLGD